MASMFLMFSGSLRITILMPFYLQDVQCRLPREVGLFLIILPVIMAFVAPTAGRLSDRIGYRWLTSLGMLLLLIGQYFLTHLEPQSSTSYIVLALIVVGTGVAVFNSPNSSAMMGSVTDKQRPHRLGRPLDHPGDRHGGRVSPCLRRCFRSTRVVSPGWGERAWPSSRASGKVIPLLHDPGCFRTGDLPDAERTIYPDATTVAGRRINLLTPAVQSLSMTNRLGP